ncbi:glycerate kinase [Mycobacterium tuberculosis]|uniref:glycerate kinase n=1 Tax=Mycobacterium tuberculosis TaxID=1773 RepID=UPI000B0EEECF|nr:glycerate kinase [Mycobacterium tuberculosis]
MRVLVAPDCYGDSLSAVEAAAAIATGWTRSRPGDSFIVAPQSDGGPGFVEVLGSRLGETRRLRVCGPLNTVVNAAWVFDPGSATAYLECAQACGLGLLGGLDAARRQLADVEVIAASDVEYPLLGPWGTARVFAPQKGADMATVAVLEGRLAAWAIELDAAAGRGVSAEPGAGAAGGIGAGLLAVGGRYQSGAAIIAEHTHFADDLADAELIVTGEGRFDEQSLHGKVVGAIAAAARPLAIPVIVLAGQVSLDKSALRSAGIMAALSIAEYAGSVRLALADAANQLMGLASQVAARLGNSGPSGYR